MATPEDDAAVSVSIEGDLAPLNESFDQATQAAASAGAVINDALGSTTTGPDKLTESAQAAASALGQIPPAAQAAASGTQSMGQAEGTAAQQTDATTAALQSLAAQLNSISQQLGGMGQAIQQVAQQEQQIAESSADAASGIGKVNEAIETAKQVAEAFAAVALAETLREIASAAIEEYGEAQRVETSLTLIGGSAQAAAQQMETLRQMGMDLAVPMDTLESSARKLSAVFGVGDGLTGVLKAAANASAATGSSFDAVANSLERIQLTGAVSARQLVALGISWQDLAHTMGKSIDEAQEALKKGGQDAAADVQVVLDTINAKFGQAASAQAKGILGQLQSLKDQIRDVMESIGAAIAPALGDIITILRNTIVPAVQAAADAFGKLPAPIRDFSVLLGGIVIAAVPVTAALATLGFALQGIQTLLATVGIEFGKAGAAAQAMGVADIEAAAGVQTLATAETELAAGAGAASIAAGGLSAGMATLAGSVQRVIPLGTAFLGAFAAESLYETIRAAQQLSDANAGLAKANQAASDSFATLQIRMHQLGIDTSQLDAAYKDGIITFQQYQLQLTQMLKVWTDLHGATQAASAAVSDHAKALKQLQAEQDTANQQLKTAKVALDAARESYDGSANSADILARAIKDYDAAMKAAHGSSATHIEDLSELATKSAETSANYAKAAAVLKQAQAAYDAGTGSIQALIAAKAQEEKAWTALHPKIATGIDDYSALQHKMADVNAAYDAAKSIFQQAFDALAHGTGTLADAVAAQKQLETAAKNASQSLNDEASTTQRAIIQAGLLREAAQDQVGALVTAVKTYQQLRDSGNSSADAQLALAKQIDAVTTMARDMGVEVTKTGNVLQFSIPDAVAQARPGLIDLIAKMNGVSLAGLDVVNVNGKLVITMKSAGDAAKAAGQDMGGWTTSVKQVFDESGKLNGQVAVLKGSMDQQAASADKLTGSQQRLASAAKGLGDVMVVTGGNLMGLRDHMESLNTLMGQLSSETLVATENAGGLGVAVQSTADIMRSASADVDSYTNALNQMADAAENAARMDAEWNLQTKANKLTGNFSAQDVLGIYQAAGASQSDLDSIAQGLGLVKLGNGVYETPDVFQSQQQATTTSRQAYIQQKEANPSTITKYDRQDFPELADAYAKWAAGLSTPASTSTSTTNNTTATSSTSTTTTANTTVTASQSAAITALLQQALASLPQASTVTLGGPQVVNLAPLDQQTIDAIMTILGLPSSDIVAQSTDAASQLSGSLADTSTASDTVTTGLDTLSSTLTSTAAQTNAAFAKVTDSVDAVTGGLSQIATTAQSTAQQFAQFASTGLTQLASGLGSYSTALTQAANGLDAAGNPTGGAVSSNPGYSRVPLSQVGITLSTPPVSPIVLQPQGGYVSLPGPSGTTVTPASATQGVSVNVTIQAGTVVGQNGMQQLSDMVGKNVVNQLKQITGLRIY